MDANKQKWVILASTLALIAATAGLLSELRAKQRLGPPGVKTTTLAGGKRLKIELPDHVLDYDSKVIEPDPIELDMLPPDTSLGKRLYTAPDGFEVALGVVLMGADRTSLHKPEFCLQGQGWRLDPASSTRDTVHIEQPWPYDLPVSKIIADKQSTGNGQTVRAIYVYWFVANNEYTARHWQRMWWMAKDLLSTGVLQRWAYISCLAECAPGQEDAAFARVKKVIAAAAPQFQLTPGPTGSMTTAGP